MLQSPLRALLILALVMLITASVAGAGDAAESKSEPAGADHKLVVYYFHTTVRCATCRKLESLTREVIESRFADEVKNARLEYRVVNTDEDGNGHFINDYSLFTKSIVLSDVKGGAQFRWKNLDKIWEKIRDEEAFRQYVEDEIRSYL
jgi:hypothetical protein